MKREWKLPRLISDGMVLQQGKKIHLWGFHEPGQKVLVSFMGEDYTATVNQEGIWEVFLKEMGPGGPYTMQISDGSGREEIINDILIGDVFMCSGQSNMELPMERVRDQYPEEIAGDYDPFIRTFKITEHSDFRAPLTELLSGEWKKVQRSTILQFSATAYFFAKAYRQLTGVPVGLINASLGGSLIESWMSRDMLAGYEDALNLADQYKDEEFVEARLKQNQVQSERWHQQLDRADPGLSENWQQPDTNDATWKKTEIPFFFRSTDLKEFIGSVWFRRTFKVPESMAGKEAKLWLGTIVDSDTVYVNGVQVGHTDYQYPPRKYPVPGALLKEGENSIVIRVKCERGKGRFTPDKKYMLFNRLGEINLKGTWKYRIGAACKEIPETDFVNWKPTGLYNGMTAPCHPYTIGGVLWYQGESNTHAPDHYLDLMERMIKGYRVKWQDDKLPFFYVQLPNFDIERYDSDTDETGYGWPAIREMQRRALEIPNTGMVTAIDIGEDNDLHPLNKKDIGRRLALLAAVKLHDVDVECSGPVPEEVQVEKLEESGFLVRIVLSHITGGIYAHLSGKGSQIWDFELIDPQGKAYPAAVLLKEDCIELLCEGLEEAPVQVRYCYKNTSSGALIFNGTGLPMSPFVWNL